MGILIWDPISPFYIKSLGVKISPISTAILNLEENILITNKLLKKPLNNCCRTLQADEQYSRFLNY